MKDIQSFEVTEYSQEHRHPDAVYSTITEIVSEQRWNNPAVKVHVSFVGNLMKLSYHCYEMMLPTRLRDVESQAKKVLDDTFKNIKKELSSRIKKGPKLAEKKEMANYSVQKVSLNERYMYSSWRFYELD